MIYRKEKMLKPEIDELRKRGIKIHALYGQRYISARGLAILLASMKMPVSKRTTINWLRKLRIEPDFRRLNMDLYSVDRINEIVEMLKKRYRRKIETRYPVGEVKREIEKIRAQMGYK